MRLITPFRCGSHWLKLYIECTTRFSATDMADQSCPACLDGRVLGGLRLAETAHHYVTECTCYEYIPFRRSPKFRDLLTGLGAYTLHEFYIKNDPNLIVKFLLCCRDKRTECITRARMPDLATNDTKHTVINVDNNSSDGP